METAAAVQPVTDVHPHLINLCLYECDLRDAVGGTLSIFVPEKWDVCQRRKALSVDCETNCCIYVLQFSEGTIDFCWMYSQKGSHECRCFIYIVCMTLLVNRETDWSFCFLLEAECCYRVSRVCRDITAGLGKSSVLFFFKAQIWQFMSKWEFRLDFPSRALM